MNDYHQRLAIAMRDLPHELEPIVGKEILHYSILDFMQEEGYLKHVVFMGGTSLRLCHGSPRFSEDLDFAAGVDFNSSIFKDMASGLKSFIEKAYGFEVSVKEPKSIRGIEKQSDNGVSVDTWQLSVIVHPGRPELKRQKVKIEFLNLPSLQPENVPIQDNYNGLHRDVNILIPVKTPTEIMADKLVSFPDANNIRYRDIWDIGWLSRYGIQVDTAMIDTKIESYQIDINKYLDKLHERLALLPDIVRNGNMAKEMQRFLAPKELNQMQDPNFQEALIYYARDRFERVTQHLKGGLYQSLGLSCSPDMQNQNFVPVDKSKLHLVEKLMNKKPEQKDSTDNATATDQKKDYRPG